LSEPGYVLISLERAGKSAAKTEMTEQKIKHTGTGIVAPVALPS
jgi:hypothetical protein